MAWLLLSVAALVTLLLMTLTAFMDELDAGERREDHGHDPAQ